MSVLTKNTLALALGLFASVQLAAQTMLPLNETDIELLDLEFAPLQPASDQSGISLPGRVINSPEQVSMAISRFSGTVERWYLQAGSAVQQGDILLSIRSQEILDLQQHYLDQDNATALLRQQTERERQLFDSGVISRQRLQTSESLLRRSELALAAGAQTLRNLGLSNTDLEALRQGELELGLGFVRAPVDGVVIHRRFATGDYVEANATVVEMSAGDRPWLAVQLPARLLPMLGEQSYLTVSGSGERLSLRQRDYAIDPDSQSVELYAEFDGNAEHTIGQIMPVMLHPGRASVFVPASGVVHEGRDTVVYIRSGQGVEARVLDLLPVGDGYQAVQGVSAGEQILVRGTALVKGMQLGLGSDE